MKRLDPDAVDTRERGVLVAFRVMKGSDQASANKFCKKFYGQDTSSHGGRYRYRRSGFLDDVPHRRLIRGVLVLREEDRNRVVEFLRGYGAEIHVRTVVLTQGDNEALAKTPVQHSQTRPN